MSATMSRKVDGLELGAKRRRVTAGAKKTAKGKAKSATTPARGGDGGVAPKPPPRPHARDNGLVHLTGREIGDPDARSAFESLCAPTADPSDVAHLHRVKYIGGGPGDPTILKPPEQIRAQKLRTTPRRYHPSQMTSRGVGFDSMFDRAFRIGLELQDAGIEMGWRPLGSEGSPAEQDRARVLRGLGYEEARTVLRPRLSVRGITNEEQALERAGSEMIRAAAFRSAAIEGTDEAVPEIADLEV